MRRHMWEMLVATLVAAALSPIPDARAQTDCNSVRTIIDSLPQLGKSEFLHVRIAPHLSEKAIPALLEITRSKSATVALNAMLFKDRQHMVVKADVG